MTLRMNTFHASLAMILALSLFVMSGCRKSNESAKSPQSATAPNESAAPTMIAPAFKAGDVAFVRVKEYTLYSGEPNATESGGGSGYILRSLSSGVVYSDSPPATNDGVFSFGEAVTLIEKKNGPPVSWVVEKNGKKVQLPEYLLAAGNGEINSLKEKGRIPDSIALVYKENDETKIWGVEIGGIQGTAVVDSHGLHLMDYPEGTSPFALKGNVVMFDASVANDNWAKPLVFDANTKPLKIIPYCMYYCVTEGDKPAFEPVTLGTK